MHTFCADPVQCSVVLFDCCDGVDRVRESAWHPS